MQKLLITGASGFLGWNLCRQAREEWEVYSTYHRQSIEIEGVQSETIDLTDFELVKRYLDRIAPDAIIHTAAASSPNFCQTQPEASARINVGATECLAQICASANIPLVFTSTDLVFDGTKAPYVETDPVCPLNIYGEQKVAAERAIVTAYAQATICRMPLMFGNAPPTAASFIQPWLKALQAGESLQLFVDEFRTPASAQAAARGLLIALKSPGQILNLGGKDRISRYEFGRLMAEIWGFDRLLITPISQRDLKMAAPRAADVSLDSTKAIGLGYNARSLRTELEDVFNNN